MKRDTSRKKQTSRNATNVKAKCRGLPPQKKSTGDTEGFSDDANEHAFPQTCACSSYWYCLYTAVTTASNVSLLPAMAAAFSTLLSSESLVMSIFKTLSGVYAAHRKASRTALKVALFPLRAASSSTVRLCSSVLSSQPDGALCDKV